MRRRLFANGLTSRRKVASRILCVVVVSWLGIYALLPIRQFIKALNVTKSTRQSQNGNIAPVAFPFDNHFVDEGYWTFAGWKWRVHVSTVTESELTSTVEKAASAISRPLIVSEDESEKAIIMLMRQLCRKRSGNLGTSVYCSQSPQFVFQGATTSVNGRNRLLNVLWATRLSGSQWRLYNVSPATPNSPITGLESSHLMPLPEPVHQIAARWNDDDQLLFEVDRINCSISDLQSHLRWYGWNFVQQTPSIDGSFLCERDDLQVRVWSPNNHEHISSLILTRIPYQR